MKVVLLGVGNEMRGDDGIGLLVAEKLHKKIKSKHESTLIKTNVPENFIVKIEKIKPDILMIFDASDFGAKPGEFRFIEKDEIINYSLSTHNAPLSIMLESLKEGGIKKMALLGIQIANTEFGEEISKDVISSLEPAVSFAEEFLYKNQ